MNIAKMVYEAPCTIYYKKISIHTVSKCADSVLSIPD